MLEGAGVIVRVVPDDKANEWYVANPYASTTLRGGNSVFTRILFLLYGNVDSGLTGEAAFMAAAAVVQRTRRMWSGRWVFENRPIKERGKWWPIKLRRRYVEIEPCDRSRPMDWLATSDYVRGPKADYEAVGALCEGCPVRQECLEYAAG